MVESVDFVRPTKVGVYLKLQVSPAAKTTEVKGRYGQEALKLSVAAPPAKDKANMEIERYLSTLFNVLKSGVAVVIDASSLDKLVLVCGVGVRAVRKNVTL